MKARGLLAVATVTAVAFASGVARADGRCAIDPSPVGSVASVRATLAVHGGEAPGLSGYWISDEAMARAARRMTVCIDGWAQCKVDLSTQSAKVSPPGWRAWIIGLTVAILIGTAAGITADRAALR